MTPLEQRIKRAIDMSAAGWGLLALSPLLGAIALAIRLDSPGPALFRQDRLGKGGKRFRIYKFRTMTDGAGVTVGTDGRVLNTDADARHTRVGRVLRRLSLDELPQLLNVLAGDMSLVGPRPDLPEAMAFYSEGDMRRLAVLPGITGPAQIGGRNELPAKEKWRLESEYASNAGLCTDVSILTRTLTGMLKTTGVYRRA